MKVYLTIAVGPSADEARPLCASTNPAVVQAALDAIARLGLVDEHPARTPPGATSRRRPFAQAA